MMKGDVVYKPYKPKFVGVVRDMWVELFLGLTPRNWVVVDWEDGTTSADWEYSFKSLDELIEQHRKAIATHERSRARALGQREENQ